MKTSELTGKQLDYWVAKSLGKDMENYGGWLKAVEELEYHPSTNNGQCFELMQLDSFRWVEKFRGKYNAMFNQLDKLIVLTSGPTLNIAICRAFVASVYGEESDE